MSYRNTQSYLKLREQIQEAFDFVYVVSQSVPCMKLQASLVRKGEIDSLPKPDYFTTPNPLNQISSQVKGYKGELARYILLSSFSYFESFVVDVIKEFIQLNGGIVSYENRVRRVAESAIKRQENNHKKEKAILSKKDPKHAERRRVTTRKLVNERFVFPSRLFSHLGVKALLQKVDNLKSVDIPRLMMDGFCMEWSTEEIAEFHRMRDARNRVAHGKVINLSVKNVIDMNTRMRDLAQKIDQHLIEHFFISERYL